MLINGQYAHISAVDDLDRILRALQKKLRNVFHHPHLHLALRDRRATGTRVVLGEYVPASCRAAITMADVSEHLCQRIDDRLAEMIRQITDGRDAFTNSAQHVHRTVEAKLEQVRSRAAVRSSQFQKERKRVNSKVKRELANAKEEVEGWKESGQTEKLRRYAAQAEHYALAAILDANDAIDDALIAAMESLTARAMADGDMRKS